MTGGVQKRFTDNTRAARLLKAMFLDGKIKESDTAAKVWRSNPEFQKFTCRQFGDKYKKFLVEFNEQGLYCGVSCGIVSTNMIFLCETRWYSACESNK